MQVQRVLDLLGGLFTLARAEVQKETAELPHLRYKDLLILEYIWTANQEHSVRMADLTKFMSVSPAATSQLVNSYEMLGVAQRVRSTEDRRANFVQIHPMLLEVVDEKMDEVHKHMEAYLDWLGPEDAEALQRLLERTYEYSTKVHEENQD